MKTQWRDGIFSCHPYLDKEYDKDGRVVSSMCRLHFTPKEFPWYSFLLDTEWTAGLLNADRRNSLMSIKIQQMQQYADIYSLQSYSTCFGCHSTHHQEYYKLYLQPVVQVILLVPLLPFNVVWSGLRWRERVQFLILLMMGAVTPETCRVALQ